MFFETQCTYRVNARVAQTRYTNNYYFTTLMRSTAENAVQLSLDIDTIISFMMSVIMPDIN